MKKRLKLIELFSGIGSQTQALKNIGIDHEVVGIAEIDKYAITSYEALHGKANNLGDISKIDKLPYCDLLTYSFPCQSLSTAGKQEGIKKGTRSGLLLEVERLLEIAKVDGTLPKYLLLENVKNLVGKKHKKDFSRWLNTLEELGYSNFWEVLSASDYRTPQKRQRVFAVSILGKGNYTFPKKQELRVFAEDYLDEEFESKYMVSKRLVDCFSDSTNRNGFIRSKIYKPHTLNGKTILKTITTRAGGRAEDNFIQLDPADKYNVRKLTPLECWRFMGFTDDQFHKAQTALNNTYHKGKDKSNTQLYKQAGNSIVVTVLEEIFRELFLKEGE